MTVSYESIRKQNFRFWPAIRGIPQARPPKPGDKWPLDEVFIRIRGKIHYLWGAVDQNEVVQDIPIQKRRDTNMAKRFFRKLLRGETEAPQVIVTDKLKSYAAA